MNIRRMKFALFLALTATVALLPAARAELVFKDDSGHEIRLKAPAKRIITLAPHATEMLYAAGAGDRLIGTVEYSYVTWGERGGAAAKGCPTALLTPDNGWYKVGVAASATARLKAGECGFMLAMPRASSSSGPSSGLMRISASCSSVRRRVLPGMDLKTSVPRRVRPLMLTSASASSAA